MTPLKKLLLGTTHLHPNAIVNREPISAVFSAAAAFSAGTFTLVNFAAFVGVNLVTSWALKALMPKPDLRSLSQGLQTNKLGAVEPHQYVYGQVRKGGTITFYESTGTNNKFLHQIIALAGHEVEEIGTIYIDDEPVELDENGFVTSAPWNSKIRIKKHLGSDDQTADSDLVAETSVDTNFRGRGIAYLYVRLEYDQNIFANGIPTITAVVKGKKVFDPRTSTTAWSDNAALCIRDYLTDARGLNDQAIDDTAFSVAANICDETVSLATGGTEKRYTMNGAISADATIGDVLTYMMTSCAGTLWWGVGNWQLKVGAYTPPVKTFGLSDLRSGISIQTRMAMRDNYNIIQGTFVDSAQDWITVDFPRLYSAPFVAEDGGEEVPLDMEFPLTTSAATVQRLAKMTLFRGREQMTFSADFGLSAMETQVGDIVAITNERYGWAAKEFEVVGWRFYANQDGGDLRVNMTLRETSSAAFSWTAEETAIISNNTSLPDAFGGLTITGLTASGGGSTQGDGTFINSVLLDWDDVDNAFLDHYEVEWKPLADSVYSATTTAQSDIEISPVIDGVEYIFRVRAVSVAGVKGLWESVQFTGNGDVTAPNPVTNLSADAGYKQITLQFDPPTNSDFNRVEVFESATNSFESASSIGYSSGSRFVRAGLENYVTRYYWVRALDFSGNASSVVGPVSATTLLIEEVDLSAALVETIERAGVAAVNSLPASGDFVGQLVFLLTDNTLYQWDGAAWSTQLYTDIKDDSVTTDKIAASAIVATKIAAGAVTADKIAVSELSAISADLGTIQVDTANIADLAVDTIKVTDRAITTQTSAEFADFSTTSNTFVTVGSVSFSVPSSGEQVIVGASFIFEVESYDNLDPNYGYYNIVFNGSVIASDVMMDSGYLVGAAGSTKERVTIVQSKLSSSGTNTLSVETRDTIGNGIVRVKDLTLFSLVALK